MDPFAHLLHLRKAWRGAAAAGLFLTATACWSLTHAAGAAPFAGTVFTPEASQSVTQVQFGRAGPLARARFKRRLGPARVGGPKRSTVAPGKLAAPRKTTPPVPKCGVRGRPPCSTGAKTTGPVTVTPPPPPGCKGSACPPPRPPSVTDPKIASPTITTPPPPVCRGSACPPPGGPGVIVTPPPLPGGGGFGANYFAALPRIAEGARANPGPALYGKQVLVLIDQGQPAALEDILAQQYNLQRLNNQTLTLIAARAQLYAIPDNRTVAALASVLGADPRVRLAQGNFAYRRQGETNKTQAEAPQYALSKMSVAPAHEMALGRGVRIAVIDSAIDAAHPDLAGAVLSTFDATNRSADTGDGHGTAVAGIIGARGAVRGVAPMAEILAVRAFAPLARQQPIASSSVILLRAIEWSVVNGAQVLNMSFVGPRDPAVQAMIEAAQKRNAVIVAAAGNGGSSAPPAYPAAYPGVIAVTAIDATDKRYAHANRGTYIAISAPGVDILAPADGGRHAFLSGTSFAAAHVSGIVALLLERSRSLQPEGALAVLSDNAVDLGPAGRDEDFGFGRADAFAALRGLAVSK
jgi:subtilisin family serine protease